MRVAACGVFCSLLQFVAVKGLVKGLGHECVEGLGHECVECMRVAACCSVLQCVAVCCSYGFS